MNKTILENGFLGVVLNNTVPDAVKQTVEQTSSLPLEQLPEIIQILTSVLISIVTLVKLIKKPKKETL